MLEEAARLMRASVDTGREERVVYRRAGSPLSAVSDADRVPRPGRREPDGLLVPGVPAVGERSGATGRVSGRVIRSPNLHQALRAFCLGAFAAVSHELDDGGDVPFSFEEHQAPGSPTLYEYRPLVKPFLDARAGRFAALADAQPALAELEREPAAAVFAQAHSSGRPSSREALTRTVLLPLLAETAEACGGFDWDDSAFDRVYAAFEASLFGSRRAYGAIAPLVGVSVGGVVDLGGGLRVRHVASGELAAHWPQAGGLLPEGFEREPDRLCVLELEAELGDASASGSGACPMRRASSRTRSRRCGSRRPARSRPAPSSSSGSTGGPTGFVRCCRSRRRRRRVRASGWTRCGPSGHGGCASGSRRRTTTAIWERRSTGGSSRSSRRTPSPRSSCAGSLTSLLGGGEGLFAASLRAAAVLGETPRERSAILDRLRLLAAGDAAAATSDLVRSSLVAVLEHGDRAALLRTLDETLLGLRPKPTVAPEPALAVGAL